MPQIGCAEKEPPSASVKQPPSEAVKESPPEAKAPRRSRVVLVRDEDALTKKGKPDAEVLQRMLDQAVVSLTELPDLQAAWKSLIDASDTVGIKSNVWRYLATPSALEDHIRRRVHEVGVPEEKIGVGDRGVLRQPVFQQATALINIRPLRTHHWSGVGSLIKNYIMFTPRPQEWHGDSCANLAGLWELPIVKGKTRLNILVMLTPLYQSKGPHAFAREYTWPYKGLLVGFDPVATDATGLRILEAQREAAFGKRVPFNVSPKHVRVAAERFGLGVADAASIDLVKLGWQEGVLI
jgi:hypothetical protein